MKGASAKSSVTSQRIDSRHDDVVKENFAAILPTLSRVIIFLDAESVE